MADNGRKLDPVMYWEILWRRKWLVAGVMLLFVAVGFYWAFNSTPKYASSSTILLRELDLESRTVQRYAPEVKALTDFGTVRAKILSPENLRRLMAKTNLLAADSVLAALAKQAHEKTPQLSLAEIKESLMIQKLREEIVQVKPNGVNIIQIAAEHENPELAYKVAQNLVDIFVQESRRTEMSGVESGLTFSRQQMEIYKKRLDEAEAKLRRFRTGMAISAYDDQSLDADRVATLSAIMEATVTQVDQENKNLAAANARLGLSDSEPTSYASPLLGHQHQQQREKLHELISQMKFASWNEAEINRLNGEIKALDDAMQNELMQVLAVKRGAGDDRIWFDREMARLRLEFLEDKQTNVGQLVAAVQQSRLASVAQVPNKEVTEERLKHDVDQARELYEMFLQQTQGSEMQAALQNTQNEYQYRILEPAQIPLEPISMSKRTKLMICGFLGTLFSLGLAFGVEFFNRTFLTVDEVKEFTQLPVVGIMPRLEQKDFSFDLDGRDTIEVQRVTTRLMQNSALDNFMENDFSVVKQRTMLITSSIPSEGKSTFAAYLAASLAMMQNAPVLLIDADLRRPTQYQLFKVENQNGLANLLEKTLVTKPALRNVLVATNYNKLSLIPSGRSERKPLDLFSAKQFLQLFKQLKKDYPFIIIDAPPVIPVNDALVLGRHVDSILYLVKAGETPRDVVKRGLELVKTSTPHAPGIIVNNLKEVLPYYYKSNYYKYDYADVAPGPAASKNGKLLKRKRQENSAALSTAPALVENGAPSSEQQTRLSALLPVTAGAPRPRRKVDHAKQV